MELLKEIWRQILIGLENGKIFFTTLIDVWREIFTNNVLLARFIILSSIIWIPLLISLINLIIGGIKKCLKRK